MTKMAEWPICWICSGPVPTAQNPGIHNGSLSRFDNESYCCDDCGQIEAVGFLITPLPELVKEKIIEDMAVAMHNKNRDLWQTCICTLKGSLTGYLYQRNLSIDRLMRDME